MNKEILQNKIDFCVVFTVENANPNGDPLAGNRPREDFDGFGEMSDVSLKRKIRNRLQDMGEDIFVKMEERADDGYNSLSKRAEAELKSVKDKEEYYNTACQKWFDVRAFGQVFAFKGDKSGVSVGVRGPVSLHPAFSVDPVEISSIQITKSVNSEPTKDGKKSSDTMGMKHRVNFGVYVFKGSINCQLAEKTGFSKQDAEKLKEAIQTIFDNDASSARPDGSMNIRKMYWWTHSSKIGDYPSFLVHNQVKIKLKEGIDHPRKFEDYDVIYESLDDNQKKLKLEIYEV